MNYRVFFGDDYKKNFGQKFIFGNNENKNKVIKGKLLSSIENQASDIK